jgi:hypothetical protein
MSSTTQIPLLGSNTAPGNYLVETDNSSFVQNISNTMGAAVVVSDRGLPLPTVITSPQEYLQTFGTPNSTVSLAPYSVLRMLNNGFPVTVSRAIDSSFTNAMGFLDGLSLGLPPNVAPYSGGNTLGGNGTTFTPLSPIDYQQAYKNSYLYTMETILSAVVGTVASTATTGTMVLTGTNVLDGTSVTSTLTLTPVAPNLVITQASIQDAINTFISGLENIDSSVFNNGNISSFNGISATTPLSLGGSQATGFAAVANATQVIAPTGYEFELVTASIPLQQINTNLLEVFAVGAGSYANNTIGFSLANFDFGTPQILSISLIGATYGEKVLFTYLGQNLSGTITSSTGATGAASASDVLNAINVAIMAYLKLYYFAENPSLSSFFALTDTSGTNGTSPITNFLPYFLFGPQYPLNPQTLNMASGIINLSGLTNICFGSLATPALVTVISNGIPATMSFDFNVYINSSTTINSTFRAALNPTTNNIGESLLIESVINNLDSGSQDVAVVVNPALTINSPTDAVVAFNYLLQAYSSIGTQTGSGVSNLFTNFPVLFLAGGNNSVLPTNNEIAAAWADFANTDYVSVNILMGGGYTDPIVVSAINSVIESRGDCEAFTDVDSNYQSSASSAIDYRQNIIDVNTSRMGISMPDQLVTNLYNGPSTIYEPSSGFMAALTAQNDFSVGPWQAAAGVEYGTLTGTLGSRYLYDKIDRGLLNGAGINVIKKLRSGGLAFYGAKTMLGTPSLLQFMPIRRTLTYCEIIILNYLETVDFLNITPNLMTTTQNAIKAFLKTVKRQGGIQNYSVNAGPSVNTTQYQDNGQFNVQVVILPYEPSQYVVLNAVIANAITFTEYTTSNPTN